MAAAPMTDLSSLVDRVAQAARARGFDAFEVRGEATRGRTHKIDPRGEAQLGLSDLAGVGIRVWRDGAAAHASVVDMTEADIPHLLDRADKLVAGSARRGSKTFPLDAAMTSARVSWRPDLHGDPFELDENAALEILRETRDAALATVPDATVQVSFAASERQIALTNSAGGWIDLRRYHSGLYAHALVKRDGRAGDDVIVESGVYGLKDLADAGLPQATGAKAARCAEEGTRAKAMPAGRYRVLVDHQMAGCLAHESFGHLAEFDLVATGWSVLQGKVGERLADARLSIVDAPVPPQGRTGVFVPVDDEGTRGTATRILDQGVLRRFMHQRDSASSVEGATPTGNARALSMRYPPIVRMRNTYVEPGDLSFDEAVEQLGDGLYLCGSRGGSPHSDGSFMFTSQRGYRVEKGQIVEPVRGPSIVGNILHFLPHVEGLTKDFGMFSNNFGGCGKWDQVNLHVGFGGPHILAADILVGGHAPGPGTGAGPGEAGAA